jgi:hypothetical protein
MDKGQFVIPTKSILDAYRLPSVVIERLQHDVVPHIIAASESALEAHSIGGKYSGQYIIGTHAYSIAANRILLEVRRCDDWEVVARSNDILLHTVHEGRTYSFRTHRVDPDSREPRGGKMAKQAALFLSDDIGNKFLRHNKGNMVIGYDISEATGLGKITVEILFPAEDRRDPYAYTLATLHTNDFTYQRAVEPTVVPEAITAPTVRRVSETLNVSRKNE